MIDTPDTPPFDTERLLADSVAQALEHEDPERFLAWFRTHLSRYFMGAQQDLFEDPDDAQRMAAVMGRSIWNAMPLPGNGLHPRPLPEPGRNERCICGSGRKYKRCCARMAQSLPLDSRLLLPMVLKQAPKKALTDALRSGRAPLDSVIEVALMHAEDDKPRKAAETLEPLFEGPVRRHDEQIEYAMDLLCDQYDVLGRNRKKAALLAHVINAAPRSPLRSGAWQRLATIRMDDADPSGAWEAFRQAQHDNPDAPSLGLLEVQLLFVENRLDEARKRAAFWERRLRHLGFDDERTLGFLRAMADDPHAAMVGAGMAASGEAGQPLADWLAEVAGRPLPAFEVVNSDSPDDADDMQAALRDRLHGMGVPASQIDDALDELTGQLDDLQDQPPAGGAADVEEETDDDDSQYLMPPPDVAAVEALWREVRPVSKPFSIQPDPFDIEDPWEPDEEAEWMSFLAAHPEAFDSLDIVDDLLSIARSHPHSNLHWVRHALQEPLLRRAEAIVRHALREAPETHLAWPHTENRPALRSLARLVSHGLEQGNDDEAVALAEWLLRLNPSDNHGFRTLVADARLRVGDDEGVVALADQFPDDMFPELAFGRVLALYRLQRLEEARQALGDAKRRLPKVLRALTAKRLARPKMNPPGITLGGDDQAWLYREEMRDVWLATPGAVEWLKAAAKEC